MRFIPPSEENAVCYSGELPAEYRHLQIRSADTLRTIGSFGTVISQHIKGTDFAIWKHDFFIIRPVLLYPYVPEAIYTLNYMIKGNIPCELVDVGKLELCENTYNLYHVPPVKQYAWLPVGHFTAFHVDLSQDYLEELATEFEPVKHFLTSTMAGNAKVVRATHYAMDGSIRMIIKDIVHCQKTGAARNIYLRSRINDLLLIFSRDLLHEEKPVFGVDMSMLEEIKDFLMGNYQMQIKLSELGLRFGINSFTLSKEFKAAFDTTIHQYLISLRMERAAALIAGRMPVKEIAFLVGYPEASSFTRAFRLYFMKSPTQYRADLNAKKENSEPGE